MGKFPGITTMGTLPGSKTMYLLSLAANMC